MKSNLKIALLASALFCNSLFAGDCTDVDLRNDVLGKAREQGDISWCFVHAAADVITYKIGKRVSATELGTTYFKNRESDTLDRLKEAGFQESGWVATALKEALKNGICLEEDMPSENFVMSYKLNKRVYGTLPSISAAIDFFVLLQKKPNNMTYLSLPHISKDELLEHLDKYPVKDAWEKIVDKSCEGRKIQLEGLKVKSPLWTRISTKRSLKIIDDELDKENVLGVTYYSSFLKDIKAKKSALHSSVVVGRRWNTESRSCDYLIRNSWGVDCSRYDTSLKCEKGHIWVPKDLLKKHVYYVDYLETK